MTINRMRRATGTLALTFAATIALAGCATGSSDTTSESGGHGSRIELYPSVSALAQDSSAVLVGTVTEQQVAADIDEATDFTISSVEVVTVSAGDVTPGTTVEVRQLGSEEQVGPAPMLTVGSTYLLYLTPSGLDGDLASQFYITGGNAGLYEADGSAARSVDAANSATFTQVQKEEGEGLPSELTLDEAAG